MASKKVTAAVAAVTEALTEFVEAIVLEGQKAGDLAEAMPSKKKKPADDDEEDDDAKPDPAAKAKALKQLAKLDLDEADRPTMKPIADALGIDVQGKKTTEVRAALAEALKAGGKKTKPADDDEEDDEKPAKKKKPAADDDDDDEEKPKGKKKKPAADDDDDDEDDDDDDVEYPDTKTMKKEVRIFTKANKKGILKRDPNFFDDDEDGEDDMLRLHQILADEDELKKTWKENIAPLHANNDKAWKKTVKMAEDADE